MAGLAAKDDGAPAEEEGPDSHTERVLFAAPLAA